ncbi:GlxA family transcriptional regulator [Citricoccus sp. NPDC055426]|uniref:GlxA family transcriptional regulator n=1 Tax=Citricoccus sp. NPDC055426 TaxID=3155536 RepID=UPI00343111AB
MAYAVAMSFKPRTPQIRTPPAPHRVVFVVFDGVTMLDVSGPAEVFHQATAGGHPYAVSLVSSGGRDVTASSGMSLAGTVGPEDLGPIDTLVVPGSPELPQGPMDPGLLEMVRALAGRSARVASVCTGAFVLAELGLLDGRRATTHWRHAATLARRYPRVRMEPDVIHVRDGPRYTSAGITAGIDLTLALVEEDHGSAVSREIARELVMFMQRPGGQTQYSTALSGPPAPDSALRPVLDAVHADPAAGHGLDTMARAAGVSPRHLTRLFHRELLTTPARWVELVRLDRAMSSVLEGHSITVSARLSGFGSDETLRRAFARHLGTTPTEYRNRFAAAQGRPGPADQNRTGAPVREDS